MPKHLLKFSKEQDELLLEKVKSNPFLFDLAHKNYKNVILKDDIWTSIDEFLKCTRGESKIRWRSLRDLYNRKKKEQKLGTGSARKTFEVWPYSSLMTFLEQCSSERTTFSSDYQLNSQDNSEIVSRNSNAAETTSTNETEDPIPEDTEPSPMISEAKSSTSTVDFEPVPTTEVLVQRPSATPKRPKKKTSSDNNAILALLEERAHERKQLLSETNDPINIFFQGMAATVKTFPPDLVAKAKLKVCEVITNLELELHARSQTPALRTPTTSVSSFGQQDDCEREFDFYNY